MLTRLICCAVLCLTSTAVFADSIQQVNDAGAKLEDAANYSWRTVTSDIGDTTTITTERGKTSKDGYTQLQLNTGDTDVRVIMKGSAAVMNAGDGWKSQDDLADNRRAARFMAMTVRSFKSPVAVAARIVSKLKDLKPEDDALGAELSGDDASNLLSAMLNARRPMQMSDTKVAVRFWIQDGILSKYEIHATGSVATRNGDTIPFNRTITVSFSDIGSTTIDVSDEAKKKLDSAGSE